MSKTPKWTTDPSNPEVLVRKFGGGCEARIMCTRHPSYSGDACTYEIELFPAGDAYSASTLPEAKRLAEVYFAGYRSARA